MPITDPLTFARQKLEKPNAGMNPDLNTQQAQAAALLAIAETLNDIVANLDELIGVNDDIRENLALIRAAAERESPRPEPIISDDDIKF